MTPGSLPDRALRLIAFGDFSYKSEKWWLEAEPHLLMQEAAEAAIMNDGHKLRKLEDTYGRNR